MDTSVDDSSKRAAPAGESDERDSKKQKPGDESEHMEVSHVERMMQEDVVWSVNDVSDMCEETSEDVQLSVTDMNFDDETTGELFNQRLVREAEDAELQRFKKMGVYDYVGRQTAHQDGEGIFVKVRWVRVNKGTKTNPHMKCRLVAQELGYGARMDEPYANTPSLRCIKLAMYAAQKGKDRKLMTLDVQSAFLCGAARRKIYIELPSADPQHGSDEVGLLRKALRGTRDAPQIWQSEVPRSQETLGFRRCALQPSVYIHDAKEILLVIHVGDFLVAASQDALDWVYKEVSKVYELKKKKIIGSAPEDAHETTYLNRKLKWNEANWMSCEGDEKHADVLLRDWGLVQCRAVSSTLTKELEDKIGDGCKLSESEERRVRRSIARINFMSQDRPDLCCAARILSKHMASPTDGTRHALIHVVKYLKGHTRCVNNLYASIPTRTTR